MTSSPRTRVLDFLDEWTSRYPSPHIIRLQNDDDEEWVSLDVADLYVLADAAKEEEPGDTFADRMAAQSIEAVESQGDLVPMNPEEQYAIELPELTLAGLNAGLNIHPISTGHGRKFLTGAFKLAFREALLWRVSERDPWQVIMTGPLGVDG